MFPHPTNQDQTYVDSLPAEAPWPYWTEKRVVRYLGVDRTFVEGLGDKNGRIRACKIRTPKHDVIRVFNRNDIMALKRHMDAVDPTRAIGPHRTRVWRAE
jgi:hypothetical protein